MNFDVIYLGALVLHGILTLSELLGKLWRMQTRMMVLGVMALSLMVLVWAMVLVLVILEAMVVSLVILLKE